MVSADLGMRATSKQGLGNHKDFSSCLSSLKSLGAGLVAARLAWEQLLLCLELATLQTHMP